jgi:hypothetical protein
MTKSRKHRRSETPPEAAWEETTIWFGAGIPEGLRRRAPELDDSMPAWLREMVARWRPVDGCSNLFFTESLPVEELGREADEWVRSAKTRRLASLMCYGGGPGLSSWWTVAVIDFGPSSRLYVEWREVLYWCLLAWSDDPDRGRGDRNALRALFGNNGMEFDRVIMHGPPDEASGSEWVPDEFLVELLARAFGRGGWWGAVPRDSEGLAREIVARGRR